MFDSLQGIVRAECKLAYNGSSAVRNLVCAWLPCVLASVPLFAASVPPLICASGGPVGTIELRVFSPSPRSAKIALPLRTMTKLEEGDTVLYRPVLRPHEQRKGEVTLVLAPADKQKAGRDKILIFDARPADKPQHWVVPWRTSLVAFVYGPSGLNVKKVESFLDKDDELIGELADYADKTAKTEALIAALTAGDNSQESLNAALHGFSSQFGTTGTLNRTAPMNQQTMIMLQTLNPTVASYDPLAGQGAAPVGQTAGLATSVAEMFFGSPIGLAAGGTAMLLNVGAMAFPRSEFRSMFSQPMPDDALGLCAKTGAPAAHTRVAYLWAVRIPNVNAPKFTIGKANSLPSDLKSPLPLTGPDADWKFLDHARNWTLTPDRGKPVAVKVQVLANTKSIEVALAKDVKPGRYSLSADWDWGKFEVQGFFGVRPLDAFASAKLKPASQDRLVAGGGKVPLTLENGDFEFVTKVEIKKLNDEFASESSVPFVLPQGLRGGVQDHMDIQADTSSLDPGAYNLILTQVDGKAHDVRLTVLPPLPVIDNLPVTVNQGASSVNFELHGKRLDLLEHVEPSGGSATLGAASADGTSRPITWKLKPGLASGVSFSLTARVANRSQMLTFADALNIVAPRPSIAQIAVSQIPEQEVHLDSGELPGALVLSAMLRVANLPADPAVHLECEQSPSGAVTLQPGQQSRGARLEQLTADQLFLTFDTAQWINGCDLQVSLSGASGASGARSVGRIVGVPSIEQFSLDPGAASDVPATLIGRNLENIDKVGWAPDQPVAVLSLPQPLPDDGGRQKLDVRMPPPPSPDAVLYLWLRGDRKARVTTIRAE